MPEDPWSTIIEPYFERALGGRWLMAEVIAALRRPRPDLGEGAVDEVDFYAKGRVTGLLVSVPPQLSWSISYAREPMTRLLVGTLDQGEKGIAGPPMQLAITLGDDAVTTTWLRFSDGSEMTAERALVLSPPVSRANGGQAEPCHSQAPRQLAAPHHGAGVALGHLAHHQPDPPRPPLDG